MPRLSMYVWFNRLRAEGTTIIHRTSKNPSGCWGLIGPVHTSAYQIAGNFSQGHHFVYPLVAVENLAVQVSFWVKYNLTVCAYAQHSLEKLCCKQWTHGEICDTSSAVCFTYLTILFIRRMFVALLAVHSVKPGVIEVELIKACQHPVSSLESPGQTAGS